MKKKRVRVKVIDLRNFILYFVIVLLCLCSCFFVFKIFNKYYYTNRKNIEGAHRGMGTVSVLETVIDDTMPTSIYKKNNSNGMKLSLDYRNYIKYIFGDNITAVNLQEEDNEEMTQKNFNENEKKICKVVNVEEKNKQDTNKTNKDDKNKDDKNKDNEKDDKTNENLNINPKVKKANDELYKKIKTVHTETEKMKKIAFWKEDNRINGNPNDEVNKSWSIDLGSNDKPQILIFHTHNRETFASSKKYKIPYTDTARTTDNRYNIVRVGEEITKELKLEGFNAINYTGDNEGEMGTRGAYERARKNILAILKKYPSIKMVIDVHRDSAYDTVNNQNIKFISKVGNEISSQIMLDISSDYYRYGNNLPSNWRDWHNNLRFAAKLDRYMSSKYPGIMRPMCISRYTYNQDITANSITIEVGSDGNSLDETIVGGKNFGKLLGEFLKKSVQ